MLRTPMPSLYATWLGAAWSTLAPAVRLVHGGNIEARGVFRVRRGENAIARLVGTIFGMPAAGERVPVSVAVTSSGDVERWTRSFAGRPLVTLQWAGEALMVEALGPVLCIFALRAEAGALVFEQVGARLGGRRFAVRLPRFLAPRIEGRAEQERELLHVDVRIHAPILGLLVAYDGHIDPAEVGSAS
jgi:hypothetical protein